MSKLQQAYISVFLTGSAAVLRCQGAEGQVDLSGMMGLASSGCRFESGRRGKINSMVPEPRENPPHLSLVSLKAEQHQWVSLAVQEDQLSWSRKAERLVANIDSDAMELFRTK